MSTERYTALHSEGWQASKAVHGARARRFPSRLLLARQLPRGSLPPCRTRPQVVLRCQVVSSFLFFPPILSQTTERNGPQKGAEAEAGQKRNGEEKRGQHIARRKARRGQVVVAEKQKGSRLRTKAHENSVHARPSVSPRRRSAHPRKTTARGAGDALFATPVRCHPASLLSSSFFLLLLY